MPEKNSGDVALPSRCAMNRDTSPDRQYLPVVMEQKTKQTQKFYDESPLSDAEFRTGNSILSSEAIQIEYSAMEGGKILDAGCGPGNVSFRIVSSAKNAHVVSMDISSVSVGMARKRLSLLDTSNLAQQVVGSVLEPPFCSRAFDFVISSGVVHHTREPFRALSNLGKILKDGGKMYLSVYNRNSFYFPEFHTVGALARTVERRGWGKSLDVFISLFGFLLRVLSRQGVEKAHVRRIFGDRYLTPVASFHTGDEIRKWCKLEGFRILKAGSCKFGTLIWFVVEKAGEK